LGKISNIFTEPIDLEKIKMQRGEKTFDATLIISPASLRLISGQDRMVKVSIWLEHQKTASEKSEKNNCDLSQGKKRRDSFAYKPKT